MTIIMLNLRGLVMNKNIEQYVMQFGSVCRGHLPEESLSKFADMLPTLDLEVVTTLVNYSHYDYVEVFKLYLSASLELFAPKVAYHVAVTEGVLPTSIVTLDLPTTDLCLRAEFKLFGDCGFSIRLLAFDEDTELSDLKVIADGEVAKRLIESTLDVAGLPRDTDDQITRPQVALLVARLVHIVSKVETVGNLRESVLHTLGFVNPETSHVLWDDRVWVDDYGPVTLRDHIARNQLMLGSFYSRTLSPVDRKAIDTLIKVADDLFDSSIPPTKTKYVLMPIEDRLTSIFKVYTKDYDLGACVTNRRTSYSGKYGDLYVDPIDMDTPNMRNWVASIKELLDAIKLTIADRENVYHETDTNRD